MGNKKSILVKCIAFPLIFAVLFGLMAHTFRNYPDYRSYHSIAGFYEEAEGSLDAVYLGSSNCYAFWNAPAAWHSYGLAVYPYTSPSQPFYATEYLMRETRKTQPDAMFIVNVNSVEQDDLSPAAIHYLVNYMPDSENKAAVIDYLAELLGYSALDKLEFRFPWLRIRELWKNSIDEGPLPALNGLKGASTYQSYFSGIEDISDKKVRTARRVDIPQALSDAVIHLLDYCDGEGIQVLFVSVPRAENSKTAQARINTVCDMIRGRGYPVLDMSDMSEEAGLDLTCDYYNNKHTNLHGSLKFTNYLCRYLIQNYGMKDRRGAGGYESWDLAWTQFEAIASPWMLAFETDAAHRDYALKAPAGLSATVSGQVRWDSVDGAEGYAVYRKTGKTGAWTRLGETDETAFEDTDPQEGAQYTVVPWRGADEEIYYGNFDYLGVGIQ